MKTKILSVLLACLMVLSVLPMTAFAEGAHTHATCVGQGNIHNEDNCPDAEFVKTVVGLCGVQGYDLYQCPDCGDYFATNFTDPENPEHKQEKVPGKAPTCVDAGVKDYWYCTNCKYYFWDADCEKVIGDTKPTDDQLYIAPLDHDWYETGRDGDCVNGGFIYYACSRCDATKQEKLDGKGEGHVWGNLPTITQPPVGCTDGEATYSCTVCGAIKYVKIVSDDHQITKVEKKDPTCTNPGHVEYYYCSVCDKYFETAACEKELDNLEIPATGHNMVVDSIDPGNCSTPKTTYYVCANGCGHTETVTETDAAHNFGDPLYRAPTCTIWGALILVCQDCGYNKQLEKYEPTGHMTYDDAKAAGALTIKAQPTCTKAGLATWTCTWCGDTKEYNSNTNPTVQSNEDLKAHGHNIVEDVIGAMPTCKKDGYTFDYCANADCDVYEPQSSVPAGGIIYDVTVNGIAVRFVTGSITILPKNASIENGYHDWQEFDLNESTCNYQGQLVEYCKICAEHKVTVLGFAEHSWDAGVTVVTQEMTCTQDKIETTTYTCLVCGETKSEETITPTDMHNMVAGTYVPASCVVAIGYTPYSCANCSTVEKVYNNEDVAPEAFYEYESVEDAMKWHAGFDVDSKDVYVQGDCETKGLYTYKCTTCTKNVLVVIEGTGHHGVNDGVYNKPGEKAPQAPTCTVDGNEPIYECPICGDIVFEDLDNNGTYVIPAGHTYGDLIEGYDATCDADGEIDHYYCTPCGKYFDADKNEVDTIVIPALGHDLYDVDEVPADCVNAGASAHKACTRCDYTEGKTVIDALGHKFEDVEEIAPTCYSTGVKAHKLCSVCGAIELNGEIVEAEKLVIGKVGHELVVADEREADCLLFGYVHLYCKYCKGDVNQDKIFDEMDITAEVIVDYKDKLGHKEVIDDAVPPTCQSTGLTEGKHCDRCGEVIIAQEVLEKVPHNNGPEYGNQDIINDCQDKTENRLCQWCGEEIPKECQEHFFLTVPPTCLEDGYILKVCVACEKSSVWQVVLAPGKHTEADPVIENNVAAKCEEDGSYDTVVYCSACGEELSRVTTTVPAIGHDAPEDEDYEEVIPATINDEGYAIAYCENGCGKLYEKTLPRLPGVIYEIAVDNAVVSGANYADSSLVAVTVSINSLVEIDVHSVMLDVVYDADVVKLESVEFLSDNFKAVQTYSDNGGYVTLYAQNDFDAQGKPTNVKLLGEDEFAVLYFRIDNRTATGTTFSFANGSTVEYIAGIMGGKTHEDDEDKSATIVIDKFMDVTGEGAINNADALAIYQIITGDINVTYDASADIDKSGVVDYIDLELLAAYMVAPTDANYKAMVDARYVQP